MSKQSIRPLLVKMRYTIDSYSIVKFHIASDTKYSKYNI